MSTLERITKEGIELTLERIEAAELRVISSQCGGSFNSEFGAYFCLRLGQDERPIREILRELSADGRDGDCDIIGWVGVLQTQYYDPHTNELVFSGAQIEDLEVRPGHEGRGYATLLVAEATKWLKEQKIEIAYMMTSHVAVHSLLKTMEKTGGATLKKLYQEELYQESQCVGQKTVYELRDF